VRSKILINDIVVEQISIFSYVGCSISYGNEKEIAVKISIFIKITGIINRNLKASEIQKHTRLQMYNFLALPTLFPGCEAWAIREPDKSRMTSA
jgi:hypothetical protein